jgi:DNA-binding NarL/FixJ family response regulator
MPCPNIFYSAFQPIETRDNPRTNRGKHPGHLGGIPLSLVQLLTILASSLDRFKPSRQSWAGEGRKEMENKPRILIVDDEPKVQENLRATFERHSYQVAIATDKTQAQEMAQAEKPDVIILGTIMPRGEAFALHRWFKQTSQFSDIPTMVIDAPDEKRLLRGWTKGEGLLMEAEDYLIKPVEPEALVPLVEKMLVITMATTAKTEKKTTTAPTATTAAPATAESKMIKVLVADDHAIVRDGIRALLGVQKDMQVVGEATNGKDAIDKTRQLSPDVVLMDIVMPGMNGLEATKQISREFDDTKVLMLSQYDDEENVRASNEVGAQGFIPKKSASTELLSAIRSL